MKYAVRFFRKYKQVKTFPDLHTAALFWESLPEADVLDCTGSIVPPDDLWDEIFRNDK